ncbi:MULTISPECIES: hemerythrin domain-containing protein [Devosia]|uniref:Uncharacterized protein n=1 Tax=Devosia equisanguinis TaxID=2490941 RepID=A0A447I722_9HYPH|nr:MULTISPECIES: hemerythrin domain-containing protein [Devosia]ODT48135.1 MAG: hypothetical protein ABS74_18330 [Pelagibacterium sp. SCN 63-126]ODU85414.1 MAG: hypothetical protein ABT14_13230 [Pelagibacterium sp. SCN 63-17]OJX42156.1 MAG: hypothetical protein BGO80_11520 [Devosia sp. 63-57]VDS03187.1 hypothetical protein DEVEQU_00307 [Devosia equisanguinis]
MLDKLARTRLGAVDQNHAAELELCRVLEEIADALPDEVDAALCIDAAKGLETVMAASAKSYREQLEPAMEANGGLHLLDLNAMLARLRRESQLDIDHAEELQELLSAAAQRRQPVSAEALGYMLRGFFDSRRRRIALEQELLAALRLEAT